MSRLDDLVEQIEFEFGVNTAQASRAALFYLRRSYEAGAQVAERDLREALRENPLQFRPDPRRLEHLSRYSFGAIRDVERLGRERVRAVFQRAAEDATMTTADVAKALGREFFDVAQSRLDVIARTETNRAGNAAKTDRYQRSGVTHHEAVTATDTRVRDFESSPADHTAVHGQVVRIGEAFRVPRLRGGPNDNGDRFPPFDPNCRCTVIPVVPVRENAVTFAASSDRLTDWRRTIGAETQALQRAYFEILAATRRRVVSAVNVHGADALRAARSS